MSNKLDLTQELPETNCTRENIYNIIRTAKPTDNMVDTTTIKQIDGVLTAGYGIPQWVKVTLSHTLFQTAAASNAITLFTLPGGGIIHGVKIKASTAFAGTGITALTLAVGTAGNATKYAPAFDVVPSVSDTNFQFSDLPGAETHATAGKPVLITATATGANLDATTAGSVDVWVLYSVTE